MKENWKTFQGEINNVILPYMVCALCVWGRESSYWTTLRCAIRSPHANLLTFHNISNIHDHGIKTQWSCFSFVVIIHVTKESCKFFIWFWLKMICMCKRQLIHKGNVITFSIVAWIHAVLACYPSACSSSYIRVQ